MRFHVFRTASALLLPVMAGCGNDHAAPDPPLASGLWTVSGSRPAILNLAPGQLSGSGDRTPATAITTSSARLYTLTAVAFDAAGTMWIASKEDALLLAFPAGALTSSGARAPATVISATSGSLSGPTGLAFDSRHRLWVVNNQSATLVRFDPAQLAAGGAQVPAVVLSLPGNPVALTFDAAGSLWVSDNQFHTIAKYAAAQLEATGSPAPVFRLTSEDGLVNPAGMAFDAMGNLWVANTGSQTAIAFSPAQLSGTSPSSPHTVLSAAGGSLGIPVGLAFDGDGSLWVVGGEGILTKFGRASLGASGAPEPSARLRIADYSLIWSVAFWPRPAGLPLY